MVALAASVGGASLPEISLPGISVGAGAVAGAAVFVGADAYNQVHSHNLNVARAHFENYIFTTSTPAQIASNPQLRELVEKNPNLNWLAESKEKFDNGTLTAEEQLQFASQLDALSPEVRNRFYQLSTAMLRPDSVPTATATTTAEPTPSSVTPVSVDGGTTTVPGQVPAQQVPGATATGTNATGTTETVTSTGVVAGTSGGTAGASPEITPSLQPPAQPVAQSVSGENSGKINFAFDSDKVETAGMAMIEATAKALERGGFHHGDGHKIRVEGDTDQPGTDRYNIDLSRRRASSVAAALKAQLKKDGIKDIDDSDFQIVANGKDKPVEHTTGQSLANRRAEISMVDATAAAGSATAGAHSSSVVAQQVLTGAVPPM